MRHSQSIKLFGMLIPPTDMDMVYLFSELVAASRVAAPDFV